MAYFTPEQLSFPPVAGHTLRADFEGGALSSDLGVLLLRGIDRQIGLTARLAAAIHDTRHPPYIDHPMRDLLAHIPHSLGGRPTYFPVGIFCTHSTAHQWYVGMA